MQGVPLKDTIVNDTPVREAGLYGTHGGHVNVTDGQYTYMRAPATDDNTPLYDYTYMPTHMRRTFSVEEMHNLEGLAEPFDFTKGCRVMKVRYDKGRGGWGTRKYDTLLHDIDADPKQENHLDDSGIEEKMIQHLIREMKANDAPPEQYQRLGLEDL